MRTGRLVDFYIRKQVSTVFHWTDAPLAGVTQNEI